MKLRHLPLVTLTLAIAACSKGDQLEDGGVYASRTVCPQVGVPAGTGDITLFTQPGATSSDAIDVTATITNVRATCSEDATTVASTITFDVLGQRRDAGAARQVVLPTFNVAMQGGTQVVAKKVGNVVLSFPDGAIRAQTSGTATIRVSRRAVTLSAEVQDELTRRRKPGDVDAAIDPLTVPAVRDAVARATFEQLIGFQLTNDQLRYNVTR